MASPQIPTLSLHDALPISIHFGTSEATALWGGLDVAETNFLGRGVVIGGGFVASAGARVPEAAASRAFSLRAAGPPRAGGRSEEHTSELQSRQYLVCRLLLYGVPADPHSFPTRRSSDLHSFRHQRGDRAVGRAGCSRDELPGPRGGDRRRLRRVGRCARSRGGGLARVLVARRGAAACGRKIGRAHV